jgi:hypothetical protein
MSSSRVAKDDVTVEANARLATWFARNVRQVCDGLVRPSVGQIPRHGAFGHGESELQQLAVDPRRAPQTVLHGHPLNEASKLYIDAWSSRPPP